MGRGKRRIVRQWKSQWVREVVEEVELDGVLGIRGDEYLQGVDFTGEGTVRGTTVGHFSWSRTVLTKARMEGCI